MAWLADSRLLSELGQFAPRNSFGCNAINAVFRRALQSLYRQQAQYDPYLTPFRQVNANVPRGTCAENGALAGRMSNQRINWRRCPIGGSPRTLSAPPRR